MKKRLLPALLALALVLTLLPMSVFGAEGARGTSRLDKVDPSAVKGEKLKDRVSIDKLPETVLDPDEVVRVSIVLDKASTLGAGYSTQNIAANASAMSYRDGLRREQVSVQQAIETQALGGQKLDVAWNLTLAANIISANVRRGDIEAIAAVDGVKKVVEETRLEPAVVTVGGELEPNMAISGTMNGAQDTWDLGIYGAGSTVAIIDTGIDTDHQSFDEGAFNYAISKQQNVDLFDTSDVAAVLDELNISGNTGVTANALHVSNKIPFAYNYVDKDLDVTHDNDGQGEHGSHVAGIAAANRFIPQKDESGKVTYAKALDAVKMAGNAPDAQIIVMKVFGKGGGAYTADYMAAIEDAIVLGADAINLSLGSGNAGPAFDEEYKSILDSLVDSDSVVSISAGNAGTWGENSYVGGLYNDGVNFDTVGSPGSYTNAFTVASVDNDGMVAPPFSVKGVNYPYSDTSSNYDIPAFTSLDTSADKSGTEYDFVMIETAPGTTGGGNEVAALPALKTALGGDLSKYIVIIHRGTTDFPTKTNAAASAGAAAVIVANNAPGVINMDLSSYTGRVPAVSTTQAAGQEIWASGTPTEFTYNGTTSHYVTGKMTVYTCISAVSYNSDFYTMSSFSSWGVPGDLSLKPEITAPGGEIWSVNGAIEGGKDYELMSGTSMAAPQVTGLSALVQQYLRKEGIDEGMTSRALTQALLMSTARPMTDADGNYYPVFQQGAGLVNAGAAVSTPAYITVDGNEDGKVKVELGDDPAKTGNYEFSFTVHNLTDSDLFYSFDSTVFTQDVAYDEYGDGYLLTSTTTVPATVKFYVDGNELVNDMTGLEKYDFNGDGNVDKRDAALLLDLCMGQIEKLPYHNESADVSGDGKVNTYDVHKLLTLGTAYAPVPANGSVTVTAKITNFTLGEKDYPVGGYVEAYVNATAEATPEGVLYPDLGLPVFGWYGNWTDSSMFDFRYEDIENGVEERAPYLAASTDGQTNFMVDGDLHIVFDGDGTTAEGFGDYVYVYSLIRNAGNGVIMITNAETGEEYYRSDDLGYTDCAFYYVNGGVWQYTQKEVELDWDLTDKNGQPVPDGTEINVSLVMAPEYYAQYDYDWTALTDKDLSNGELGEGAFLTTTVVVDQQAPEAEIEVSTEGTPTVTVKATDNINLYRIALISDDGDGVLTYEYCRSVYQDAVTDETGELIISTLYSEDDGPMKEATVKFDGFYGRDPNELLYQLFAGLNNYWGTKERDLDKDVYLLEVEDMAGNISTYRVFVGVEEAPYATSVTIDGADEGIEILKGNSVQLSAIANPVNLEDRGVTWSSKNPEIATVTTDGLVTGVGKGTATITAKANCPGADGKDVTADITVEVTTLPVTITGVLQDEDGHPMFFTWDFDKGTLEEKPVTESSFPQIFVASSDNDGSFYIYNSNGMFKVATKDGAILDGPWAWSTDSPTPWGMVANDDGLHWTYGPYLMVADKVEEPTYMGFNFTSVLGGDYLMGVAVDNTPWKYDLSGTTYEGDYTLYALDTSNSVWTFMIFEEDGSYSCLRGAEPSDLTASIVGNEGETMSNLVYGPDGALYYSMMTGETNELYRLVYDEEEEGWLSTKLGDFGQDVWPAVVLNVESNTDSAESGTHAMKDAQVCEAVEITPAELASVSFPSTSTSPATPSGSLNSIDTGEKTTEAKTSGVTINKDTKTVTVPVYTDSTNGKVTVQYDTRILTLSDVAAGNADVFDHNLIAATDTDTTKPVLAGVELGFGDRTNVNGKVAELTFKFNSYVNTNLIVNTTEDGSSTAPVSLTVPVKLSSASDRRPGAGGIGGGTVTPPPSTTEPSEPDNPGEDEPTPGTPVENKFDDVADGDWYTEAVNNLDSQGIMTGTGNNSFSPNQNIDRRSIATIIYRLAGKPETDGLITYTDVATGSWESDPIAWISAAGIMTGPNDTQFNSTKEITREELITVLWRYAQKYGYDVSADGFVMPDFPDTDEVDTWAAEAMCWAVRVGLIQGNGAGALNPTGTATRAEVAVMIDRFLKLEKTTATA